MFGLVGFRPEQLFNKIIGYFMNLMFLFNYSLILTLTIARLINIQNSILHRNYTLKMFVTGFAVVMMIKFTILIYIYFKRFNLGMLLQVITRKRRYSLSKKELLVPVAVAKWRARLLTVREVSQSNPATYLCYKMWHVGNVTGHHAVYTLIQCTPPLVEKAGVAPDMTFRITACKQERVQARYPLWI